MSVLTWIQINKQPFLASLVPTSNKQAHGEHSWVACAIKNLSEHMNVNKTTGFTDMCTLM